MARAWLIGCLAILMGPIVGVGLLSAQLAMRRGPWLTAREVVDTFAARGLPVFPWDPLDDAPMAIPAEARAAIVFRAETGPVAVLEFSDSDVAAMVADRLGSDVRRQGFDCAVPHRNVALLYYCPGGKPQPPDIARYITVLRAMP